MVPSIDRWLIVCFVQDILRPFLLVCASRNSRLLGLALASLQKLLAHDAVSVEGRAQMLQAMQQVRRVCCPHHHSTHTPAHGMLGMYLSTASVPLRPALLSFQ